MSESETMNVVPTQIGVDAELFVAQKTTRSGRYRKISPRMSESETMNVVPKQIV